MFNGKFSRRVKYIVQKKNTHIIRTGAPASEASTRQPPLGVLPSFRQDLCRRRLRGPLFQGKTSTPISCSLFRARSQELHGALPQI